MQRIAAGGRTVASVASESLNSPKSSQGGHARRSWGSHFTRRNSGGPGSSSRRLPSVLLILAVTLVCVFLTTQMLRSVLLGRQAAMAGMRADLHDQMTRRTLSFDACFGMANQRLSILYGVLFAVELGRTVVLPKVTMPEPPGNIKAGLGEASGAGPAAADVPGTPGQAAKVPLVPFGYLYDVQHFVDELASVGVDVLPDEELENIVQTEVNLANLEDALLDLHTKYGSVSNVHITCPLFRLKRSSFRESTLNVAWRTLAAVQPRRELSRVVDQLAGKLKSVSSKQGGPRKFNVLHLRMESDWMQHCKKMQSQQATAYSGGGSGDSAASSNNAQAEPADNCMAHTDDIDKVLLLYNVPTYLPLFVSTVWELTEPSKAEAVLGRLNKAGYQVFTSKDFPTLYTSDAEWNAMLDYELALRADRFLGNSASSSSALAILERRQQGRWAAHYNGGAMPIEAHIPAPLLPWVFAYHSATPADDYMVKAAVRSASKLMSIKPFCIWSGNDTSPIYSWLKANGVTMIERFLEWQDELWAMAEPHAARNARLSPIFRTQTELLADFSRIELAVMPELEQYNYVLTSQPHVLFTGEVSLRTLASSLPRSVGMRQCKQDDGVAPVTSVLLLNLLEIRPTAEELRQSVLANRHGGNFPGFGPGAGGAFAQFYESQMLLDKAANNRLAIDASCNWDSQSKVVAFPGPLMREYLQFYRTRACGWGDQCLLGFRKSLCPITRQWQSQVNATEEPVGLALLNACETLYAPHLFWPKFQPTP